MLSASGRNGSKHPAARRARREGASSIEPREVGHLPRGECRARIAWALGRTPQEKRLVLTLLLVERLSAAEAANVLGTTVARVRGAYRQALAGLRQTLLGGAPGLAGPRRNRLRLALERFRKAS